MKIFFYHRVAWGEQDRFLTFKSLFSQKKTKIRKKRIWIFPMEYLATENWFRKFKFFFLSIIKLSFKKKSRAVRFAPRVGRIGPFIHNMHLDPFRIEIIENSDLFHKVWVIVEFLSQNHEATTILSELITFLKKMQVVLKNLPIFFRLLH